MNILFIYILIPYKGVLYYKYTIKNKHICNVIYDIYLILRKDFFVEEIYKSCEYLSSILKYFIK